MRKCDWLLQKEAWVLADQKTCLRVMWSSQVISSMLIVFIFCFDMSVLTCLVYYYLYDFLYLWVYVNIYFNFHLRICTTSCYSIHSGYYIYWDSVLVLLWFLCIYTVFTYLKITNLADCFYKIFSFIYKLFIYNTQNAWQ